MSRQQHQARLRAELIMKVRCGLITACQAADQLNVSRKTYYKWEQRGLSAMLDSVTDQPSGRPAQPADDHRLELEKQLGEAHRQIDLLNHKMALKDVLMDLKLPQTGSGRAKKNDLIRQAVAMIEAAKTTFSMSYTSLAAQVGLSYRTLMRWKQRLADGKDAVGKRGPKKVRPLNLTVLKQQIRDLDHGRNRSRGTVRLHGAHADSISRRELNELVSQVRSDTQPDPCQVLWLKPDLSWAIDGLEYRDCHVQNVQDLCSRYKFAPLTSTAEPCGEEIAGHLSRHFSRFGPPLFIKRDNAGNLNHTSVNDLLEEYMVIPINSPYYTPSYNGAIEHSQGELKTWLCKWKHAAESNKELALQVDNAAHAWNHLPRRSLSGKNACRTYFSSSRLRFTKHQRKEVYDWIYDLAVEISQRAGENEIDPTAWRVSARKWMQQNRMIVIRKPEKVSPHLNRNLCQN